MILNEIYGSYYKAVSKIIDTAIDGRLDSITMGNIARSTAFEQSNTTIPGKINSIDWLIAIRMNKDDKLLKTPFSNKTSMPLSLLEKRWLKTLLSDPRIKLFNVNEEGLENIKPLYSRDTFVYYDRYLSGDPYDDENYIEHFRRIVTAINSHHKILLCYVDRSGQGVEWNVTPLSLEYSSKDDKFRLLATLDNENVSINLSQITYCELRHPIGEDDNKEYIREYSKLVIEVKDEHNAVERVLLAFSHLRKEVTKLGNFNRRITLDYLKEDEVELIIRILSFGTNIRVISPDSFKEKLRERLEKQSKL